MRMVTVSFMLKEIRYDTSVCLELYHPAGDIHVVVCCEATKFSQELQVSYISEAVMNSRMTDSVVSPRIYVLDLWHTSKLTCQV